MYHSAKKSKKQQKAVGNITLSKKNAPFEFVDNRPHQLIEKNALKNSSESPDSTHLIYQLGKKKKDEKIGPPKMYKIVKEGWNDEEAMEKHCWSYCEDSHVTLVNAARKLGLDPPMLGHGSKKVAGGTAKDATLYNVFKTYMEYKLKDYSGRTLDKKAKQALKE
ncbi:hypothetical protein KORDIASMS9_04477 [Kordia sp. SMS9]|uniref:hypothetical protein n=1 Tax=Kordia sp. SMS9 TaxID=2282170 RepID=UPI000E0D0152|nr:hypothetical protein [Kordia sp. SMS9]AXG72209.1 hypothetical protein KORDIASMS9_04477 [Kordia sp. SMS9]